ncbi:hypothetical protein Fot_06965 [Forsythia ovata]|uniref:Uncharacterized protein n=1 Tax=Forsythia ovata TaxID=205694 RepID=A0ABD1WUH2_9LAMI
MDEDEDVEVLEDPVLTRKANKPRTASSKSPQNTSAEVHKREGMTKKWSLVVLKDRAAIIRPMSGISLRGDLLTSVVSWADYSDKSSVGVKVSNVKALVAWSMVLIEKAESSVHDLELNKRITQLEEVNAQRDGLLDKIDQLEEVAKTLKSENLSLKTNTEEVVKVGVEDFRSQFEFTSDYENLQAFFINYGA